MIQDDGYSPQADSAENSSHANSETAFAAASAYIRSLLSGGVPNGAPASAFGEYRDVILTLVEAFQAGSTPKVREAWHDLVRRHPELVQLIAGDPSQPEHRVRWTADELLAAEFPPIRWIVPGYFSEGLVFIGGRPKLGKSWLALQLVHAVASGGRIFDQEVIKAPALYLAFEDSARRLQKRMREQSWPAYTNATFYTASPKNWRNFLR